VVRSLRLCIQIALAFLALAPQGPSGPLSSRVKLRFNGALPAVSEWYHLVFGPENKAWLFSRSKLWQTIDAGVSWQVVSVPATAPKLLPWIEDATFHHDRGILLKGNELFVTSDGGRSWGKLPPVPLGSHGGELRGIGDMTSGMITFGAVYEPARPGESTGNKDVRLDASKTPVVPRPAIFQKDDTEGSWTREVLPGVAGGFPGLRIVSISFADSGHGVAATEVAVAYTADRGSHWMASRIYGQGCVAQRHLDADHYSNRLVDLLDDHNGWLSLDNGAIYRTADGGATWCEEAPPGTIHSQFSPVPSYFESLAFSSPSIGWGVEVSGALLETQDGGRSCFRPVPELRCIQVLPSAPNLGWVVADSGLYRMQMNH